MKMQNEQHKDFKTADFGCAVSLIASGISLNLLERRSNNRRVFFVFSDYGMAVKVAEAYWNDALRLNPRTLFEHSKSLKSRLYAELQD